MTLTYTVSTLGTVLYRGTDRNTAFQAMAVFSERSTFPVRIESDLHGGFIVAERRND